MKADAKVFLKAGEEREISQGFPWVYDNEIAEIKQVSAKTTLENANIPDGSLVNVYTKAGACLGCGLINKKSKIAVRFFSRLPAEMLTEEFSAIVKRRIEAAVALRAHTFGEGESCRLVFAEADLVPGLIVDKFVSITGETHLVAQFHALACELYRNEILATLIALCKPTTIIDRSEKSIRDKEGLETNNGIIYFNHEAALSFSPPPCQAPSHPKPESHIIIKENNIKYNIDLLEGQKTGFFLDQKFNRAQAAKYCAGKKVLDACSHTGGFALNAAKNGARSVVALEISEVAIEMIKKNTKLNGFENIVKPLCANVFDELKRFEAEGETFDVIILDPPAFTKSAKSIQKAYGGYKEINLRAMKLLNDGGILVTCSCSGFFDEHLFYDMLTHAAADCKVSIQIIEKRTAAPDHPILLGYPRSHYLKCAIARILLN